jgi:hypothetical protein
MNVGVLARAAGVVSVVACVWGCDDESEKPEQSGQTSTDGGLHNGSPPGSPDGAIVGMNEAGAGNNGNNGNNGTPGNDGSFTQLDGGGPRIDKAFAIYGRVGSAPGDKRVKGPGDAAVEHSVTHVMAVNPATANPVRYLSPIAADGTFAIGVDLNTPWVFVLVDSHQVGKNMIAGVFRGSAFDLDSLAATRPGMVDLGVVDVDEASGAATASTPTATLLSALGLSDAAATLLGSMDDISLRYVNPDIDGNGKIDVQEGVSYPLDFHIRYDMTTRGSAGLIPLTALRNAYADSATTDARYSLGSAIAYWANPQQFGTTTSADYRIRFPTASGTFQAPPRMGSFAANVWIDNDSYFYTSAGSNSVGISFDYTQPFPTGEYVFEVKGTALTYTNVRTHTLPELNAGADLIIPFLKLNVPDSACTGWACKVTGLDYRWMKRDGTSWVAATSEEIALVVPQHGGFLGFRPGNLPDQRLELTIPGNPATGTLSFATPNNIQGGVSAEQIANLTIGQLCHVGVSYDDTLGMRIFQGWQQGPDCAP